MIHLRNWFFDRKLLNYLMRYEPPQVSASNPIKSDEILLNHYICYHLIIEIPIETSIEIAIEISIKIPMVKFPSNHALPGAPRCPQLPCSGSFHKAASPGLVVFHRNGWMLLSSHGKSHLQKKMDDLRGFKKCLET